MIIGKSFLFNPIKKYFNQIQKEEASISGIVEALQKEKDILSRDNITLEIEINKLNEIIEKLETECKLAKEFKADVENRISEFGYEEQYREKVKFYEQNVLEQIDRKINDLTEMLVVKRQSVLAIEIICRNNSEIIRNIDRVKNVTVNALNTAVLVAKSLYNQKIILKNIKILEGGTEDIIKSTGHVLSNDGSKIYKDAVNSGKSMELEEAFNKAFNTIKEIEENNKKSFPENEMKILEINKLEVPYENK